MHKTDWFLLITGAFLLAVIIGVGIYASQRTQQNVLTYEGPGGTYRIDLVRHGTSTDYYVHTFIDNKEYIVPLGRSPYDVANVTMPADILDSLERPRGIKNLYITQDIDLGNKTDQDATQALFELAKVLGRAESSIFKLNYHSAFTTATNRTIALQLPVITCTNVTDEDAVIYLTWGTTAQITDQNDCIIIQGPNGPELLRATYKFIYHLIGVL